MTYQLMYAPLAPAVWQRLGEIPRTGWVMRGVTQPETVQEHTLALIRLAEEADFATARADGLCEILEVHDWPEAIVGDEVILVWNDEAKKQQLKTAKHEREQAAMQSICAELGVPGEAMYALWDRYEAGVDPTARLAKELDKYQSVELALAYEMTQNISGLFKEFRDYLLPVFTHSAILTRLRELEAQAAAVGIDY